MGLIPESERRIKILDYVWDNSLDPKVTKSDVMRHLREISRPMTTHKITVELIKEGKINMVKPKDKPYSQTDYLVINRDNEFNQIYNNFSEIENIIDNLEEFKRKIFQDLDKNDSAYLDRNYVKPFADVINFYLIVSLADIKATIHSDKDREILYRTNTRLLVKASRASQVIGFDDTLGALIRRLEHEKPFHKNKLTNIKNIKLQKHVENLIAIIKDTRNRSWLR